MIQFDTLPKDRPNNNNNAVTEGRYTATVFKSEMRTSKTTNQEYLNVSFRLDGSGFVNENYFDSDKPFLQYKLGRLLYACGVTLEGEGTLKDVAKVIANKKVIVDVVVNDNGYGALDYSGDKEGIYPVEETKTVEEPTADLDEEVAAAIESETEFEDEDF